MSSDQFETSLERLRRDGRVQQIPLPDDVSSTVSSDETLEVIGPVPLPMKVVGQEVVGQWYVARLAGNQCSAGSCKHVSAVVFGDPISTVASPLVRIHSTCFTGDVLGSLRCDCGPQLEAALIQMNEPSQSGLLVYMAEHEGRGIGLWSKAAAYLLQDEGLDTYEANRALGFADDQRGFRSAAALIRHLLGNRSFRLLTNNPMKVAQMGAFGVQGVVQQSHIVGVGTRNYRYLLAKQMRGGHGIPAKLLELSCLECAEN